MQSSQPVDSTAWGVEGLKSSHLSEELLMAGGFWKRENRISSRVWPLVIDYTRGWLHTLEYMSQVQIGLGELFKNFY